MNHYLLVRIKTKKKSKILLKLNKIEINIKNIRYEKDYLIFEIRESDIKRVKKYLVSEKIEILDETGLYKVKKEIKKNRLGMISILFGIIIFFILTNIVVKINIIHSSKEMRELLQDALKERGVEPLTWKKSYDEYESIIEDIKNDYKDKIEWLEIDVDGMIMNVRVEERIKNEENKNYQTCHIVASKSGIIQSIVTERGVAEVKINDHVKKGDILINGEIKLNEEVKNNVCASGEVDAEVWYTVNASMPLNYEEELTTGKMRFNFLVKTNNEEYEILKSRVGENKRVKKIRLFKIFKWEFYLTKEYEVEVTKKKYREEEALAKLTDEIKKKLIVKGSKIEEILNERYLKKSINNGNLDIEMFVAVKEQIGVVKYYNVETERGTNDEEHSGDSNKIN